MTRRNRSPLTRSLLIATMSLSLGGAWMSEAGASTAGASMSVHGSHSAHSLDVPAFCARLSLAKIGSIVGGGVTLLESSAKGKIIACIFKGSSGNLSVETQTGLSSASSASLSGAEKLAKSNIPPGLKITFAGVPSIAPTAYSWSAKIGSAPYVGLNTNQGSTGYSIEMQGALKLPGLEKLVKLEIAEK